MPTVRLSVSRLLVCALLVAACNEERLPQDSEDGGVMDAGQSAPDAGIDGGPEASLDSGQDEDGGVDQGLIPRDELDDTAPYNLARRCDELATWPGDGVNGAARVHALGREEAWIITSGAGLPGGGGRLLHLRPDGVVEDTGLTQLNDVWGCVGSEELWAVGNGGLALRKRGEGDWSVVETGTEADILGGAGCDDEVWLAADLEVLLLRPRETIRLAMPMLFDGQVQTSAARVHATGSIRMVTAYYGTTMAWDVGSQDFVLIGDTDDVISDALIKRSGAGLSLHGGYALKVHLTEAFEHEFIPDFQVMRGHRRADNDIYYVGGRAVYHDDGVATSSTTTSFTGLWDVHARADSVWAVGFEGALVLTEAGWCEVLVRP